MANRAGNTATSTEVIPGAAQARQPRLWLRGHRYDDHHDGPRRSRHAWRLALAMADGRRRGGADHDSRPRAIRSKRAEDPDRRLVPVGDRSRRFHGHDHLAGRRLVETRLASETMPLATFLATCEEAAEARVSGIAVFLTRRLNWCP